MYLLSQVQVNTLILRTKGNRFIKYFLKSLKHFMNNLEKTWLLCSMLCVILILETGKISGRHSRDRKKWGIFMMSPLSFWEFSRSDWIPHWECKTVVLRILTPNVWRSKLQSPGLREEKKLNIKFNFATKNGYTFQISRVLCNNNRNHAFSWYFHINKQ